jgi:hypothetical protein
MAIGDTVQGERGWYQKGSQVAKFIVMDGAFELADGPMDYTLWAKAMVRRPSATSSHTSQDPMSSA